MNNIELPHLIIKGHEIKYPIIQGGMGIKLSLSALVAEVTNCGGVGTLTAVGLGIDENIKTKEEYYANNIAVLAQEVKKTKELTKDGFFGINIMWVAPDREILIRTACENGAKFIVSGAGLPKELPKYVANYPEVAIIPIISTFDGARIISEYWYRHYHRLPDAIIVENPNTAGGHVCGPLEKIGDPKYNPENVIPEIVKYLKKTYEKEIPVIAAGGVRTRYNLDKMLSYGASGVQVATPFILTPECNASDAYKLAHLNAKPEDIVIIKSPVGMPGRAINNDFVKRVQKNEKINQGSCVRCLSLCEYLENKEGFYCIIRALDSARTGTTGNEGIIFSGKWSPHKMQTVQQVMNQLTKY